MTINIKLDGSRLTVVDPCPILADGSRKSVKFRIAPDADWDGLTITVVFRRVHALGSEARSVVVSNRAVEYDVPHEVLHDGWLYIGAAGVASSGTVKLTTAKLDRPIRVYESEDAAADPSGSITPEVADQILALIGTVSNLDTKDKSSLVAAINEVNGNIPQGFVKTVNQIGPSVNGDVTLHAESIDTQVEALNYQGSVEGALEAIAKRKYMSVAYGNTNDAPAYVATGDDLPVVQPGSDGKHVGKNQQIIFVPTRENADSAPTLQINDGEAVPIRLRAPKNQSTDYYSPDATMPVPAGALMRGVPYTLTFCGKYWLVDSMIMPFDQYNATMLGAYASALLGLSDSDTVAAPIINSMDGISGDIATMFIRRSEEEYNNPDESGNVTVPTQQRVEEMIRKDITAAYAAWTPEDVAEKTVANYAKTLADGSYRIADDTIGYYVIDTLTAYGTQWRLIRDYFDDFFRIEVYCGDSLLMDADAETGDVAINGKRILTDYNIPLPEKTDLGKVLVAYSENRAAWTAVTNAEEVAV